MPAIEKKGVISGVDVDRMMDNIAAITQEPGLAKFEFRTKNHWMNGGLNRSTIQGFYGVGAEDTTRTEAFVLENDEPHVLLGTDQAANPVEFVLHALAGCLTTSLVYHAAARGIRIDAVESTLEGNLDLRGFLGIDEAVRSGYQGVKVSMRVRGDASEDQLDELVRIAQRRSPVFDIVTNGVGAVEVTRARS